MRAEGPATRRQAFQTAWTVISPFGPGNRTSLDAVTGGVVLQLGARDAGYKKKAALPRQRRLVGVGGQAEAGAPTLTLTGIRIWRSRHASTSSKTKAPNTAR